MRLALAWSGLDPALSFLRSALSSSCRPGVPGAPLPARAVLSMGGLSHGVIRVNTEDKNSALTVQDVGHIMPGGEAGPQSPDSLEPSLCSSGPDSLKHCFCNAALSQYILMIY